jgi:protein-S-isoprenylcysteine O-methyltransferase Ste14
VTEAGLVVAAALVSLEAVSRLVAWRLVKRPYGGFSLPRRSLPAFLGFGAVASISLAELIVHADISWARLVLGCALFGIGWVIRYPLTVIRLGFRRWHWMRASRYVDELLPIRHPRYVGLALEAGAIAALLSSIAGAFLAVVAVPLYLYWAIELEERHLMAKYPQSGLDFDRRRHRAFVLPWAKWALLTVVPIGSYFVASFVTREVPIFESDVEVARTLLLSLAGAQGALAILGLTAWFVTVELVTSSYSAQAVPRLWNRNNGAAATLLALSIFYDIVLVARSDTMLTGHAARTGALVDIALFLSAIAIVAAVVAAMSGVRMVGPERLMSHLLERLTQKWISVIRDDFRGTPRTLYMDDPLRAVEGLLRALVDRHDVGSFAIAIRLVGNRLSGALEGDDLIALDTYLHHHLRPLISYIGSRNECDFMDELLVLLQIAGSSSPEVVMRQKVGMLDPPPGEYLLRNIAEVSTKSSCEDAAARAISLLGDRAVKMIPILPKQEETSTYNPDYDYSQERPEEEKHREWDNDHRVDLLTDQYANYFEKLATRAIESRCERAVWASCNNLSTLVREACVLTKSPRIRLVLIHWSLLAFERIVRRMCEVGRSDGLHVGSFQYAVKSVSDDDPDVASISDAICTVLARVVVRLAKAGMLDYMTIVQTAMAGVSASTKGSGARIIVEAMAAAIEHLKDFEHLEDVPFTVKELQSRIEQVGFQSGSTQARALATELRSGWTVDTATNGVNARSPKAVAKPAPRRKRSKHKGE